MANSTDLLRNATQMSTFSNKTNEIVQTLSFVLLVLCSVMFLYLMVGILNIYFSTPHIRESVRYFLFVHMIITDSLYLFTGLFMMMASIYIIRVPITLCLILQMVASSTFRVTPYNLAAMSLEQYVAICFPLRHGEFVTEQNGRIAIAVMWVIGLFPSFAEYFAMSPLLTNEYFLHIAVCVVTNIFLTPVQYTIRSSSLIISLSLVLVLIVYTYLKVFIVAQKVTSKNSLASKAGKTVLLHGFQLLLSMSALLAQLTQPYLLQYIPSLPIINFSLFMCLPRFISPLIYGLRDKSFHKGIRKFFTFNYN